MWANRPIRKKYYSAKGIFYIRLRNAERLETQEDVRSLINKSPHNRTQSLHAMFSWLKTNEEVEQFQKDYSIVDEVLVTQLVNEFKNK
jgi:hypothetical protein